MLSRSLFKLGFVGAVKVRSDNPLLGEEAMEKEEVEILLYLLFRIAASSFIAHIHSKGRNPQCARKCRNSRHFPPLPPRVGDQSSFLPPKYILPRLERVARDLTLLHQE